MLYHTLVLTVQGSLVCMTSFLTVHMRSVADMFRDRTVRHKLSTTRPISPTMEDLKVLDEEARMQKSSFLWIHPWMYAIDVDLEGGAVEEREEACRGRLL